MATLVTRCLLSPFGAVAFSRRVTSLPQLRGFASATADAVPLKHTALYPWHVQNGGKMVEFCGYSMPVQYPDGILTSHLHCRSKASVFDVSHMGQLELHGKDRIEFLEKLIVGDIKNLAEGNTRLSVFTNETGGVLDDMMATNAGDHLYLVVNAGCKDADIAHMQKHIADFKAAGKDISMTILEDKSLLALQGPYAATTLSKHVKEDLTKQSFMQSRKMLVAGVPAIVTRCGYTGEDGFEISIPDNKVVEVLETLLADPDVKPAGLGARDSLRLEAGLCLYGHELNPTITPIEADLAWLINKRRRQEGGFLGDKVILEQLQKGPSKKRVGLYVQGAPAREHTDIVDEKGSRIGEVTSGGFSPSLKKAIGQAYVPTPLAAPGTKVTVVVRGKAQEATVAKLPLVPTSFYKAPK